MNLRLPHTWTRPLAVLLLPCMLGLAQAQTAGTEAAPPDPATADREPDTVFSGKTGGTFGKNLIEVLPAARKLAVPAFRVAFVMRSSVTAQVRGSYLPGRDNSGARASLQLDLTGVAPQTLQAITDQAYATFLGQLRATGREVVPADDLKELFATLETTPNDTAKPYTKELNGLTVTFRSPTGIPLWFAHGDPWGDRGAFDLNNWRRQGEYSQKWGAAIITPTLVVNFANMSSSGNTSSLTSRAAEVGATVSLSVSQFSSYYVRSDEYRSGVVMKGEEAGISMNGRIASALPFGSYKETAAENNAAVKSIFDTLGKAMGMAGGGGAAAGSTKGVVESTDGTYSAAAQDALNRTTGTLARWFGKYPAQP